MSSRTKFLFTVNILVIFLAFTAYFPQIRINTLDNEPSYHKHFDAVSAVMMHLFLAMKGGLKDAQGERPSSEKMKLSLLQFSEAQRAVMEYHLQKISDPLEPDTPDCKRIYSDGVFELCKDQEGQYQLLPIMRP